MPIYIKPLFYIFFVCTLKEAESGPKHCNVSHERVIDIQVHINKCEYGEKVHFFL